MASKWKMKAVELIIGLAFTNNRYVPLDEAIERSPADAAIYDAVKRRFCSSVEKDDLFRTMRTAAHLRLSLDEKTIWPQYEKQLRELNKKSTLFIHDYKLGSISEDFEVVKDLLTHLKHTPKPPRVASKFPIYITSEQQMLNWASLETSEQFFTLYYDGVMPDELLYELTRSGYGFGKKLEYDITKSCYDESQFFDVILPQIFKQVIFSRSYCLKISLKYDNDFFKLKGWDKIIDLFNCYSVSLYRSVPKEKILEIVKDDSLYSFVRKLPEKATLKSYLTDKERARGVFNLIRDKNYELFSDFYECHQVKFEGGKFVNA